MPIPYPNIPQLNDLIGTDVPKISENFQYLSQPKNILADIETVDGPGSGLNADMLDNYHSTDFLRSNSQNTFIPVTDSTTVFQFLSSGSNVILNIDSVNKRVGIGTATPSSTLSVQGTTFLNGNVTATNNFLINGSLKLNNITITNNNQSLQILNSNNNVIFQIDNFGNVTINSINPTNITPGYVPIQTSTGLQNGYQTATLSQPNSIPVSNPQGKIDPSWFGMPNGSMMYYTISEIFVGPAGGYVTYMFDFTNWLNDFLSKNPTQTANDFMVIAIVQKQFVVHTQSYSVGPVVATQPSYLNNNYYQMRITFGYSAVTNSNVYGYLGTGLSSATFDQKTGWNGSPYYGNYHAYSTSQAINYVIHFIGGFKNSLWNVQPVIKQIQT